MDKLLNNNSKQKILFIGPYPPPYAGPEIAMKTLLESNLTEHYSIDLLRTNVRKSNEEKGKIDIHIFRAFFIFFKGLISRLILKRPRMVYYFVTATKVGWLGRDALCILLSKLFGAKVAIHMRAGHFKISYQHMNLIEKSIIKLACRYVDLGIVQSESLKGQFRGLVKEKNIISIHNAIDVNKFENPSINDYDKDMVLFLGHLSFAKGYCDILKIIPRIVELFPNVKFYFAGTKIKIERNVLFNQKNGASILFEDPDDCYDEYILNKYESNCVFLDVIDEKKKLFYLEKCNFLILPSYSEGFSMAVLEAITMGKPVVTTPVGALKDIVVDEANGFLAEPGDLDGLFLNIKKLLSNDVMRDNIAAYNYDYSRNNFSKEIIADHLYKSFNKLLAG